MGPHAWSGTFPGTQKSWHQNPAPKGSSFQEGVLPSTVGVPALRMLKQRQETGPVGTVKQTLCDSPDCQPLRAWSPCPDAVCPVWSCIMSLTQSGACRPGCSLPGSTISLKQRASSRNACTIGHTVFPGTRPLSVHVRLRTSQCDLCGSCHQTLSLQEAV